MLKETGKFEEELKKLEIIVKELENGDIPLEEALNKFQEGMILSKKLKKTLNMAEQTLIEVIQEDEIKSEI